MALLVAMLLAETDADVDSDTVVVHDACVDELTETDPDEVLDEEIVDVTEFVTVPELDLLGLAELETEPDKLCV